MTFFFPADYGYCAFLSLSSQINYQRNKRFLCVRIDKEDLVIKTKKIACLSEKNLISWGMARIIPEYTVSESSRNFLAESKYLKNVLKC